MNDEINFYNGQTIGDKDTADLKHIVLLFYWPLLYKILLIDGRQSVCPNFDLRLLPRIYQTRAKNPKLDNAQLNDAEGNTTLINRGEHRI